MMKATISVFIVFVIYFTHGHIVSDSTAALRTKCVQWAGTQAIIELEVEAGGQKCKFEFNEKEIPKCSTYTAAVDCRDLVDGEDATTVTVFNSDYDLINVDWIVLNFRGVFYKAVCEASGKGCYVHGKTNTAADPTELTLDFTRMV